MKKILNSILNNGVKASYQPWETYLTRKLNSITLIAIPCMTMAILFYQIFGYTQFLIDCIIGVFALSIVFILNAFKNYIWASYWFFCFGFCFLVSINLKMGMEAYMILFYFPVIISMVQILGRGETFKHLIILSGICILSITAIAIGYKLRIFRIDLSAEIISNLIVFNIILSFLSTIAFTLVIVSESIKQENLIRKMLKEKEILLAEVFHRVKNNMNIVTSLLNLKKNMSNSPEVQNALEDCRSRVFSMALVHQNIFNSNNIIGLNFKDYVKNLVADIAGSLGDKEKVEIILETEDVDLDLSNAIPCGLILNELFTNSFKYAQSGNKKIQIHVKLKQLLDVIELEVKDNGPGLKEEAIINRNTLGIELIKSLSDQINGTYSFSNDMGLIFNLKFNQISRRNKELFMAEEQN